MTTIALKIFLIDSSRGGPQRARRRPNGARRNTNSCAGEPYRIEAKLRGRVPKLSHSRLDTVYTLQCRSGAI